MKIKTNLIHVNFTEYLLLTLLFFCCSCKKNKEQVLMSKGDSYFFNNGKDSILIGRKNLDSNLFQRCSNELFPNGILAKSIEPGNSENISDYITGIYMNSKMLDCFELVDGKPKKQSNEFDFIYVYPEISRYNFQIYQNLGYRIFHYTGNLFQEPSSRENLPYYVQKITKINGNKISFFYINKSDALITDWNIDTLTLSTFPTIQFNFFNEDDKNFQGTTNSYIKLSKEITSDMNVLFSTSELPQDMTELYLSEIITKLVNLKYNTKFKKSEIDSIL